MSDKPHGQQNGCDFCICGGHTRIVAGFVEDAFCVECCDCGRQGPDSETEETAKIVWNLERRKGKM